jgi:hypothetical protein
MITKKLFLGLSAGLLLGACAAVQVAQTLPMIIKVEDLAGHRHEKVGTVQVSRERFGGDLLSADDYAWAQQSLQDEARKLGADAITQPELTSVSQSLLLFPIAEIRGRATAIRFK